MSNRSVTRFQWRTHKVLWSLSGGRLGARAVGMPVLELVTTGHKSGLPRSILVTYVDEPEGPVVFGTNAGLGRDPSWVVNLRAQPEVRIRTNRQWAACRAVEIVDEPQRSRLWQAALAANPGYAKYLPTINRPLPIVQLVRTSLPAGQQLGTKQ
jgi:F420H(2)-dependent quinone reductase